MPAATPRRIAQKAATAPPARGRVTARIPKHVQLRLEEAAELTGATVNQFIVQAAVEKAESLLERERVTVLSARDAKRLLELIDNPAPPNENLKRALEAHRRFTGGDPDRAFEWPPRAQDV